MYHQISDIDEKSPVSCWAAYHGCIGSSFCSIYFLSFIRMMIERIAPSMFVPAKLSHIPSSPRGDRARISSIGKMSAMQMLINVAGAGFSIARRKLCVEKPIHLKR